MTEQAANCNCCCDWNNSIAMWSSILFGIRNLRIALVKQLNKTLMVLNAMTIIQITYHTLLYFVYCKSRHLWSEYSSTILVITTIHILCCSWLCSECDMKDCSRWYIRTKYLLDLFVYLVIWFQPIQGLFLYPNGPNIWMDYSSKTIKCKLFTRKLISKHILVGLSKT
jgi:hypothetical protein